MKFFAIAALAATALAIPNPPANNDYASKQDIDQKQSNNVQSCGQAKLSCCASEDKTQEVNAEAGNKLLDLLGNKGLEGLLSNYKGCEPLVGVDVLNIPELIDQGKCNNNFACCNQNGDGNETNQFGLVNANIPCIPVKAV